MDRSPLSTLLELEGLTAGVTMKCRLWHSLRAVTSGHEAELADRINHANSQLLRLERAHDRAAVAAFGRAGDTDEGPTDGAINDTEARYGDGESPA